MSESENDIQATKVEKINIDIENPTPDNDYLSYNDANEFCKMINKDNYFILNSKNDLELYQKEKKYFILSDIRTLLKILSEKKILYFISDKKKNFELGRFDYSKNIIEYFNLDISCYSDISIFDNEKIVFLNGFNIVIYHYDNNKLILDSNKKFSASQIIPLENNYAIISIENKLYLSTIDEIEKMEEKECYDEVLYGFCDENGPYISFVKLQNKLGNYFMNFNSDMYIIKFNILLNQRFCVSYGDIINIFSYPNPQLITKLKDENFSQLYQVSSKIYILYNNEEIEILGGGLQKIKNFKLNEKIDNEFIALSNNTITNIYNKNVICPNCSFNKLYKIGIFYDNSYLTDDGDSNNLDSMCGETEGFIITLNRRKVNNDYNFYCKEGKECGFCKFKIDN